jgi:plasmid stabilization system protein ParE
VSLITLPPARQEIDDAFAWHEAQRPGAGNAFLAELAGALSLVEQLPRASPRVPRTSRGREVRRKVLVQFPYSVVYEVRGNDVFVLAVAHAKRRPYYWRQRRAP